MYFSIGLLRALRHKGGSTRLQTKVQDRQVLRAQLSWRGGEIICRLISGGFGVDSYSRRNDLWFPIVARLFIRVKSNEPLRLECDDIFNKLEMKEGGERG
jgi:hypothetical protein